MASIQLDEILDISHANSIHQRLKTTMNAGENCVLDGSAVEHVDTAGIQLLFAFIKTSNKQGSQIQWQGVSEKLRSAMDRLGMTREMGV